MLGALNPPTPFIEAACVLLDRSHVSGTLRSAEAILAEHPELADADILAAAARP